MAERRLRKDWLPREDRREVQLRAFAVQGDDEASEVLLSDLSYDGCLIETPEPFEPGEKVELRVVRLGVIDAEVKWAKDGRAGMSFRQTA